MNHRICSLTFDPRCAQILMRKFVININHHLDLLVEWYLPLTDLSARLLSGVGSAHNRHMDVTFTVHTSNPKRDYAPS